MEMAVWQVDFSVPDGTLHAIEIEDATKPLRHGQLRRRKIGDERAVPAWRSPIQHSAEVYPQVRRFEEI